jgi:hypothetical protein
MGSVTLDFIQGWLWQLEPLAHAPNGSKPARTSLIEQSCRGRAEFFALPNFPFGFEVPLASYDPNARSDPY